MAWQLERERRQSAGGRWAGIALTVATVVALIAVAAFALWPRHARVSVIGDSITVFASHEINQQLGKHYNVHVSARFGQRIDEMLPALHQALDAHPRVVVVNLGTNDVLQAQVHPKWQSGFALMVAMLAPVPCVGIATINTEADSPLAEPGVAADINAAIRAAAAKHRNFHILDWNAQVHAPGGAALLIPDHVHPSAAGDQRLATMIEQLVHTDCARSA